MLHISWGKIGIEVNLLIHIQRRLIFFQTVSYRPCPPVRVCQNLKNFFDQIVIIKECWDTNSKILTIFLFLNFIHLPFFLNLHLAPNLYIVVQLVLHRDS